jgi:hypothetical protein
MKKVYLKTLAKNLLLSLIITSNVGVYNQLQAAPELLVEEKNAIKIVDAYLTQTDPEKPSKSKPMSWARFTSLLAGTLANLPQYGSFCDDLDNLADKKRIADIQPVLQKYEPLLPQAIKNKIAPSLTLKQIVEYSFTIKDT